MNIKIKFRYQRLEETEEQDARYRKEKQQSCQSRDGLWSMDSFAVLIPENVELRKIEAKQTNSITEKAERVNKQYSLTKGNYVNLKLPYDAMNGVCPLIRVNSLLSSHQLEAIVSSDPCVLSLFN